MVVAPTDVVEVNFKCFKIKIIGSLNIEWRKMQIQKQSLFYSYNLFLLKAERVF